MFGKFDASDHPRNPDGTFRYIIGGGADVARAQRYVETPEGMALMEGRGSGGGGGGYLTAEEEAERARLIALLGTAKAFDPNQPRDEQGQWSETVATTRITLLGGAGRRDAASSLVAQLQKELPTNPLNPAQLVYQADKGVALLELSAFGNAVHINWMQATPQGSGAGSEALIWLTGRADQVGVPLDLFLWEGGGRQRDLGRFYQRFGFKPSRQDPSLLTRPPVKKVFDPNQPRDEEGKWVTAYHGSKSPIVDSVRQRGLLLGRDLSVWVTDDFETAKRFAQGHYHLDEDHGVVFEVHIPKDVATTFRGGGIQPLPRDIPPGWITGYYEVGASAEGGIVGDLIPFKKLDGLVIYAVVDVIAEKSFDPNQPRDEEGKWTESGAYLVRASAGRTDWPAHIISLRVPPAWRDVHYNEDETGDLLVIGRDAKGRAQYVYSQRHSQSAAEAKYERIKELRAKYRAIARENLKNESSPDRREAEHAQATSLIMATGIRPGSHAETRGEAQAYGATTLEGRHVKVSGKQVSLQFVGKSGVALNIPVNDKHVASLLKKRRTSAGTSGRLFPNISRASLYNYVGTLDGGQFTTKDFRTALGTMTAQALMSRMPKPGTAAAYRKSVRAIGKAVSTRLGNTPTVALQSYVDPTIFGGWRAISGFDKAFDPNQPRDEDGKWTATGRDATRFEAEYRRSSLQYHGTRAKSLETIAKEGLQPGFENSVFLARNSDTAGYWGESIEGSKGVILRVEIPEDGWKVFRNAPDRRNRNRLDLSVLETNLGEGIPADWIKGYYETETIPVFGTIPRVIVVGELKPLPKMNKASAGGSVYYALVILDGEG